MVDSKFNGNMNEFKCRLYRTCTEFYSEDITYFQALDELDEIVDDFNEWITSNYFEFNALQFKKADIFNTELITWRF